MSEQQQASAPQLMSAQQFWDACNDFDWYYDKSDDYRTYNSGLREEMKLLRNAPNGSENIKIFQAFHAHKHSGPVFGCAAIEKPVRPQ